MKTFKKVFFYLLLTIGVLLIAAVGSVFLFKDKIIQQFIREANKQLATPVKIGKIDVSLFEDFPHLSIVFKDVYIEDSHPEQYPLFTAKSLSFRLDPIEAYNGIYIITGLKVQESETNLKINSKRENNYTVSKASTGGGASVSFNLQNVKLQNTRVRYVSIPDQQEYIFDSEALEASINTKQDIYTIGADGDILIEKLKVKTNSYLEGKKFKVDANLVYDDINKALNIKPSDLQVRDSHFNVAGNYSWKDVPGIDLSVIGKNTDIQSLLSLLPESSSSSLAKYKSKGEVYFNALLKGEISEKKNPSLRIDFGFNNATLYHPDYKTDIKEAKLEGVFYSQNVTDERYATLTLKNIAGKLNGELFQANLTVENFKDSEVLLDFKGKLDAASVASFYPIENVKDVSGSLIADLSFDGRLSWLKTKATAQRASTRGSIELQSIGFLYGKDKTPVKNLLGTLQFNNNDLALSNVSATLGNSDFLLNGFFKNIITFLLFENQPIGIETDLKSNFLDLDQLFALGFGKSDESAKENPEYEFSISRNIFLNFNCNVNALRYKRFHATKMKGDLLVKNQMAVSRGITLQTMGGELNLSGIVDAKNPKAIDVVSSFNLKNIQLDSVFYVFENFKQDFIMDTHLKGNTDATVTLEMALNPSLRLFQETLIADISATIKNGQLNNFEPMQKLNKYLDDDGLSKIRFSDLKNDIHIENKTIYIPQMEIRTNVTNLKLSGTHTFDQRIDYHIVAPLRNRRKIKDAEAEGAFEEDATGAKIYLKITGTTDNYRVSYDTDAVKKKIVTELKNEVQELKDAFKNKGVKKKKELELEEGEYFEWEIEPDTTKRKN